MTTRERILGWAFILCALALAPLIITSNRWIDFLELTLFIAVLGQGWNVLGGYGGQYSFGHAVFFGTGAYIQALLQYKLGLVPLLDMLKQYMTKVEIQEILPTVLLLDNLNY